MALSLNFDFLTHHNNLFPELGGQAENYWANDPVTSLIKLRQLIEMLAHDAAAYLGLYTSGDENLSALIGRLFDERAFDQQMRNLFHGVRRAGNAAVHDLDGTHSEALHQLKMARNIAVWFHRAFKPDPTFQPGPFRPPVDPNNKAKELESELKQLRAELEGHQEAKNAYEESLKAAEEKIKAAAESASSAKASAESERLERTEWEAFAKELEADYQAKFAKLRKQLEELQREAAKKPKEEAKAKLEAALEASSKIKLSEADTRKIIDAQLREAGWEADTTTINWRKGTRPTKNKNFAIAEWPTAHGPADYALFSGLQLLAVVEAKRKSKNVSAAIEQAKRYSRGYEKKAEETVSGGPWGEYKVPFMFSTNGRPFLEQLRTESGIWFFDGRRKENHSYPLTGWYSPEGLEGLLDQDIDQSMAKLEQEPTGYLGLRDYQLEAISRVERSIKNGQRRILLAMATGTGKTRTAIGLIYRLIKSKRFRRVLFVVDRTSLGEQAFLSFENTRLEALLPFTKHYTTQELGEKNPEPETRLQFATIQSLVKRLFYSPDDSLPIDAYDCIVVDESHRGYALDKEMSDAEFEYRDQFDYVSKYSRVLEHFDAVRIGLTATPALHTTEIFGKPVFTYSYRRAVVDGYLVDHEPPIRIVTALAEDGMKWEVGDDFKMLDTRSGELETHNLPDEVKLDIRSYNRKVITQSFNWTVLENLAEFLDPKKPDKTLIFCTNDKHADLVVSLLKDAMRARWGAIEDDLILKITGNADRPNELIRVFKNEDNKLKIAVTVDLLTTGIDVPRICNLVFIRRVRSRILYEQMLGRATRLCDEIDKEVFRIFDAVDLYNTLLPVNTMRPVVANPKVSFKQLSTELASVQDEEAKEQIRDQFIAKLQRKAKNMSKEGLEHFKTQAGGSPQDVLEDLRGKRPEYLQKFLVRHETLAEFLDRVPGRAGKYIVSEHEDEFRRIETGYGEAERPEDYLESFKKYITDNLNEIPALLLVTQRPRELTRRQLKELALRLDADGFKESYLRTAWRQAKNEDIAATIIGFIRQQALGSPLVPYEDRVERALERIMGSQEWTTKQKKWLDRIGKQLKKEVIVDREALDRGRFRKDGGFSTLNKVFDGKLEQVLGDLNEEVWKDAG